MELDRLKKIEIENAKEEKHRAILQREREEILKQIKDNERQRKIANEEKKKEGRGMVKFIK